MLFLPQQSTSSQPEEKYTQEKLLKINIYIKVIVLEARTGALHEHLQSRWSQKNSFHLDFVEEERKTGRRSRRASQEHTLSLSLSFSLRDVLTAVV